MLASHVTHCVHVLRLVKIWAKNRAEVSGNTLGAKPGMYSKGRPRSSLAAALLLGSLLSLQTSAADTVRQRTQSTALYPAVRNILSTGTTVTGEPIRYPSGAPALITAVEITLQPGQQTGWHTHPVPLLGYILEGELTVDYGPQGERVYRRMPGRGNEPVNGRTLAKPGEPRCLHGHGGREGHGFGAASL
jgi:hypothetical protein